MTERLYTLADTMAVDYTDPVFTAVIRVQGRSIVGMLACESDFTPMVGFPSLEMMHDMCAAQAYSHHWAGPDQLAHVLVRRQDKLVCTSSLSINHEVGLPHRFQVMTQFKQLVRVYGPAGANKVDVLYGADRTGSLFEIVHY